MLPAGIPTGIPAGYLCGPAPMLSPSCMRRLEQDLIYHSLLDTLASTVPTLHLIMSNLPDMSLHT
jgi:hypothetical protein